MSAQVESIELGRMNQWVSELRKLRDQKDALKNESALVEAKSKAIEEQIKEALLLCGLTNFKGNDGDITLVEKSSVKVPKDPDSREKFRQFLDEKDMFDALWSVNSQTLNSWYREEEELAIERGEMDFSVPGIETPSVYTELRMKRK